MLHHRTLVIEMGPIDSYPHVRLNLFTSSIFFTSDLLPSGCSAVASVSGNDVLLVQNLLNGVDQYKLPTLEYIRSYRYDISRNYIWRVTSVYDGEWIIVGGDNGRVRIFDQQSGALLHQIEHSRRG